MDQNRKSWNDRQKKLRYALEKIGDEKSARQLFLAQHAALHSGRIGKKRLLSFNDEVLNDLSPDQWRFIPRNANHSIVWIVWHMARIEDVTMNLLVSGSQQVLLSGNWNDRLRTGELHTGNGMTGSEVNALSNKIDIRALSDYRLAVGKRTREIIKILKSSNYKLRVDPDRVRRIWDQHAMLPGAEGIVKYWAGRTIAGLLLMPPTRHSFLHLNEARRIKSKIISRTDS